MTPVRRRAVAVLLPLLLVVGLIGGAGARPLQTSRAETLGELTAVLTAPPMEGRRSGTPGGERAATQLAEWLRSAGLQPGGDAGTFLQWFTISTGTRLAEPSTLELVEPGGAPATTVAGTEWAPHGGSSNGEIDAEVVVVGHGISAPDLGVDDYAGVDVRDRIALALAGAPSRVGRDVARIEKVLDDTLPESASTAAPAPLVVATVRPSVADRLLPHGVSVTSLRAAARSFATGRRAHVRVELERHDVRGANVVGILPGRDPALAAETVIVGAHYDHLGRVRGEVHHGADDNASGTAVVVSLARAFAAAGGAPRTLVFALFGAEELGLVGSGHYVRHPARPLASTAAMVNFDMVGRLRDGRLTVSGVESAPAFKQLVREVAAVGVPDLRTTSSPFGPSDHARFYQAGIPVLFFHTGPHADYHKPTDTADKLDLDGMARIAVVGAQVVERLAAGARPQYATLEPARSRAGRADHAVLGVYGDGDPDGARLTGVVPGTAAERAGLREGDVLIRLAGTPLATFDDLRKLLRERNAGERVDLVYVRNGNQRSATATLD
jgi:aminopeptidase YwaD